MTTAILILAALWLLFMGAIMKVTNGGFAGQFLYKVLPLGLSFGLFFIAIGKLN